MKEFDIPTVTTTANYLHFLTFIPWLGGINVNFTFNFIRSQHSRSFHIWWHHCIQTFALPKRSLSYYSPEAPSSSACAGEVWACTTDFWGEGMCGPLCCRQSWIQSALGKRVSVVKAKALGPASLGLDPGSVINQLVTMGKLLNHSTPQFLICEGRIVIIVFGVLLHSKC